MRSICINHIILSLLFSACMYRAVPRYHVDPEYAYMYLARHLIKVIILLAYTFSNKYRLSCSTIPHHAFFLML